MKKKITTRDLNLKCFVLGNDEITKQLVTIKNGMGHTMLLITCPTDFWELETLNFTYRSNEVIK